MAETVKDPYLSVRQILKLRDRALILERWGEVEIYNQDLWRLGYYD